MCKILQSITNHFIFLFNYVDEKLKNIKINYKCKVPVPVGYFMMVPAGTGTY